MAIVLSSFRLDLERMQLQLTKDLDQLKDDSLFAKEQQGASSFRGKEEAANATTDLERRIALETQEKNLLAEVEHALHKLEEGSYGICDICGQPIESGRLEALPYASQCMTCKAACKKPLSK